MPSNCRRFEGKVAIVTAATKGWDNDFWKITKLFEEILGKVFPVIFLNQLLFQIYLRNCFCFIWKSIHVSKVFIKIVPIFYKSFEIINWITYRIGLAIAERLLDEGASVVIGSRNQKNVDEAIEYLKNKGLTKVAGIAGHIASTDDQKKLVDFVRYIY